jgi:hypothetical protein
MAARPAKPTEPERAPAPLKAGEEVEGVAEAVPEGETPEGETLLPEGAWGTPPLPPLPALEVAEGVTVE